jgi:phosphate-selective porin
VTILAVAVEGQAHAQQRTWGVDPGNVSEGLPPPREPSTTAPTPPPTEEPEPPPPLGRAYLDYSDGTFYLRSAHDNLIISTGGRVHIDGYGFAGEGVTAYHRSNGTGLVPYMFFRRFVLETGGLIRKHWFFWVGGNFAPTQVDTNENPVSTAAVYDGFIGYQWPHLQLYVGQYNIPFMMENVTSSRWLDFMERALSVRTIGAPYNKDLGITFWGATGEGVAPLEYQIGLFGGDGMNRPNEDYRADLMGRFVVRPFASGDSKDVLSRSHIGMSGRAGSRDDAYVMYDAATLSTPGGYAFLPPTYTADDKTEVHVIPSGNQFAGAAELYIPFERFDVKSEAVYVHEDRREAPVTDRKTTLRRGTLEGIGAYAQISWWPWGAVRVNGHPAGRYLGIRPPSDRGAEYPFGLQLLLRGEIMRLAYDSNARTPEVPQGKLSAVSTGVDVDALQAAATYWATKHIRVTSEYSLYHFGNQVAGRPQIDLLHEISFRLGLAL